MNELTFRIALSVMRPGIMREYWRGMHAVSAEEFFNRIPFYDRCRVSGHIASVYDMKPLDAAQRIIEKSQRRHVKILIPGDGVYPALLAQISDPPPVLYCIGSIGSCDIISVVGTRNASKESSAAAYRTAQDLGKSRFTVASGMARGIDAAAHRGALDGGYATIGVLANGIDLRYPAANSDIFERIEISPVSALISEYPPGVTAGPWTFAQRNRIISGLARATVVMQAGEKSGALITARYAADQGREIFASGGLPYDESYAGCRKLIRDGAEIFGSVREMLISLRGDTAEVQGDLFSAQNAESGLLSDPEPSSATPSEPVSSAVTLSPAEEKIIALAGGDGNDIDDIIRLTGLSSSEVTAAVISLELSGLAERKGSLILRKGAQ